MNADGTGQTRLTNNAAGDYGPRFSPNGQKILFTSFRDDASGGEIHVMNADGSGSTRLTNDPGKQDAIGRWSPSGATIIWRKDFGGCSSADLWTMNADGSSPATLLCGTGHDGEGTYSPDGTKVAFNTHRDGNGEIYVMNADTTSQTRLTFDPGQDSDIDWGPVP
jgi:TolB protein